MSHTPGYSIGHFRETESEIARLAAQAELVATREEEIFVSLGLPQRGLALDLGCGPGFVARRLRRTRPDLTIVGVDADAEVLKRASDIRTVQADATSVPLDGDSFDFAYSRLVLRHLPDPLAALREVRRLLRPGGRVVIADTDDGTLVVHPMPEGFEAVHAARTAGFHRSGADPNIGRRLPGLLEQAGFADIRTRTLVVDSATIGAAAFAAVVLAPIADGIDVSHLDGAAMERAAAALSKWPQTPGVFGMTTAVVVGATKRG